MKGKMKIGFVPVSIDKDLCKGCGLCVEVCPRHLIQMAKIEINQKGYHPALFNDPDGECIYCAQCALVCPDVVIEIMREVED